VNDAIGVRVRNATVGDVAQITAIYRHHVLHGAATFELDPPDVDEMQRRFEALERARFPYLVAADETGLVLGYAYASAYRPRPAYRYTVEDSVYIAPDRLGRGIGRLLLAALIEACTARGDRQMIAVIGDGASDRSIALHARAGFAHVGRLPAVGRKFERWVDSVLMQRPLGEGAETAPPRATTT
jgi:phosphinothricin acetyltransferase